MNLTCPVCEYAQIAGNSCPNCNADLSLIRSLKESPSLEITRPSGWQVGIALLILLVGVGLGVLGSFLFLQPPVLTNISPPSLTSSKTNQTNSATATIAPSRKLTLSPAQPTQYIVQSGDSLSSIAKRFYDDDRLWVFLVKANSKLKGREDFLEIGEVLIIPNRKEATRGNF